MKSEPGTCGCVLEGHEKANGRLFCRRAHTHSAARPGISGRVCGIDIDAEALDLLQERAVREGLDNIVLYRGMAAEIVLCNSCADIVFFGIDLHDFVDPVRVLRNAEEMVTPDGVIVDLDWRKEPLPFGPPTGKKFSTEHAAALMAEAGLEVRMIEDSGPYITSPRLCRRTKRGGRDYFKFARPP